MSDSKVEPAPDIDMEDEDEDCEDGPNRILDYLFLGGFHDSLKKELLKKKGITHIVCCVQEHNLRYPKFVQFPEEFTYLNLDMLDSPSQDLAEAIKLSQEFIEGAVAKKSKVLVHCAQGVSRSASLVLAHVMVTKKISYEEALIQVRKKRRLVHPNDGFKLQLKTLESKLIEAKSE